MSNEKINKINLLQLLNDEGKETLETFQCTAFIFFICCKILFNVYFICYNSESRGGSHERRLLKDLMNSYQKLGMPAKY